MKIGTVCSRNPVTASVSASLADVARLMYENNVGTVIVTSNPADRPVASGIVTDRDIVRAQLTHAADLSRLNAAEVMTRDPLVVCEDDSTEDALRRMRERGVRRAPVISASGALTGIVSTDDLIAHLAQEFGALARLLERQAGRGVGT